MADPGMKLMEYMCDAVRRMIRDPEQTTSHYVAHIDFKTRDQLRAHLESTWQPGMDWSNHGVDRIGGPRVWHVGHRIPQVYFKGGTAEDVRRCWSKKNVFAQWAKENNGQYTKLPPNSVLMSMRNVWPVGWGDRPGKEFKRVVRK